MISTNIESKTPAAIATLHLTLAETVVPCFQSFWRWVAGESGGCFALHFALFFATVMSNSELITKTQLKARGWTESLIKRFFPVPTMERPNPRYRSAPPVKLYAVAKIIEIESAQVFLAAKDLAKQRSARAKNIVSQKREETRQWVRSLPPPEIPQYAPEKLKPLAVEHYNRRCVARGKFEKFATTKSDEVFIRRICVNFLRHELSDYESLLDQAYGRINAEPARLGIGRRILDAIAQEHPWLADECRRQKSQKS